MTNEIKSILRGILLSVGIAFMIAGVAQTIWFA